jgi:hypothetical protein
MKSHIVVVKILLINKKDNKKIQSKWLGSKQLVEDGTLVKLDKGHLGYFLTNFPSQKNLVFL